MPAKTDEPSLGRVILTGALAWVLPGLGHVALGDRRRGVLLMIVVALTYWGGVAVAGVQSTIKPRERSTWFMAQVCAGSHTLAALAIGQAMGPQPYEARAGFVDEDVAIIYTGVAGLLNILIIIDALAATDPTYQRTSVRPPPRKQVSS